MEGQTVGCSHFQMFLSNEHSWCEQFSNVKCFSWAADVLLVSVVAGWRGRQACRSLRLLNNLKLDGQELLLLKPNTATQKAPALVRSFCSRGRATVITAAAANCRLQALLCSDQKRPTAAGLFGRSILPSSSCDHCIPGNAGRESV